ncbi:hypothetical protein Tco_0633725 [Tanacetum coccineum]
MKTVGTNDDSQACSSAVDAHDKWDLCSWIFDQDKVKLEIQFKAIQDQLQQDLKLQVSISKAIRVKAKVEREVKGDHKL